MHPPEHTPPNYPPNYYAPPAPLPVQETPNALVSFGKHPIVIAFISTVVALVGKQFTDRMTIENRETTAMVQIQNIDRTLSEHLKDSVSKRDYDHTIEGLQIGQREALTKEEFHQFATQERQTLDDIRADLRDLKRGMMARAH